ncbi:MAG: alanyl-tRNA editing protein [Sorangiineae bacterium]|nr:alanyl-tRNA editing protein [Polyangiaceae bacterium]MEB2321940.1 alanyl-tRNA editing protein [Sorangiineae bacterium]
MTLAARLWYDDPLLLSFDARVCAHGEHAGRPSLLLEETAFYPESGGQMADRGEIAERRVYDVQLDGDGAVHHLVEGELPAVGARVRARIDAERRRVHMALHTGQHLLSRALFEIARAETVSSRLGETTCTIDVDAARLPEAELARAEALANAVVDDAVPVRAWFPEPGELAALPLRRAPKVEREVRVVQIGEFDVTPCGGTHCGSSAEVGLVRVSGVERYKGGLRISFAAGRRARAELSHEAGVLRALARELTCGPDEVPAAVQRLRHHLTEVRESLGLVQARVAEASARELVDAARANGERALVLRLDGAPAELLRAIAERVTSALPDSAALLAGGTAEGIPILAARGKESGFDCGGFVKRLTSGVEGGRGGGRPERAEGRLPASADFEALARGALSTARQ